VFNTRTYFGTDGTLLLTDPQNFDAGVLATYLGESGVAGRVTNVGLRVSTEIKAFHELGGRLPELRAGNIVITGSVQRAYINGALLRLMLGPYAEGDESAVMALPSFNMKLILDNLNPPGDEGNSILTVYNVVFDTWAFSLPENDFVLEDLTFRARRLAVLDSEVPA
jgi:hypothetical protein